MVGHVVDARVDLNTHASHDGYYAALHRAAEDGKEWVAFARLVRRAGVDSRNSTTGEPPLHAACLARIEGTQEAVDLLLWWGAEYVDGRTRRWR